MAVDDSFKKPGAIPFKWEIRPGVPNLNLSQKHHQNASSERQQQLKGLAEDEEFSFAETPIRRLAPPPSVYSSDQPPIEARTSSLRSGSERFRLRSSSLAQPASVSLSGCFPSPLLTRKNKKQKTKRPKSKPDLGFEMDSTSDLETQSRLSVSSWKSLSPVGDSYLSSSFSSYRSTPRTVNDREWATFGLF